MSTWIEPSEPATAAGFSTLFQPEMTVCGFPAFPAAEIGVSRIAVNGAFAGPAQRTCRVPSFARASPRFAPAPLWACVICDQTPAVGPALAAADMIASAAAAAATAAVFIRVPLERGLSQEEQAEMVVGQ